jgi:ribonuclease HI
MTPGREQIRSHIQAGGRLVHFHAAWPSSDSWVKSVVTHGLRLPFIKGPPLGRRATMNSENSEAIQKAVNEFLEKQVLEETSTPGFTSRLFVIEQGEKTRPIIDCKALNRFMEPKHFKMENLETLASIVRQGDYLIKIDLKDAYLHVPIHESYRKYLQLCVAGKRYQFKAMPFGLNIAPQAFTRILKAALLPLRKSGIRMVAYLDDICVIAKSKEEALKHGLKVTAHLEKLGFIINQKKTCLIPKQCREFLGLLVDTTNMTLAVPSEKMKRIKREAKKISHSETWPLRKLAATIGLLNSVCRALRIGRLMTRYLLRDVRKALQPDNIWDNRKVKISEEARSELRWWTDHMEQFNGRPLITPTHSKELWTDASGTGWGAVCGKEVTQGVWSGEEKILSSNQRESLAILRGLEAFRHQLRGHVVKIHSDNMTAVSNVGHQGGTHSTTILELTKKIWEFALKNKMWLKIQHIKGADNILADQASREETNKDEYYLTDQAMEKIRKHLGNPSIDLFASETNFRCNQFVTRSEDAFDLSWTHMTLPLIHPPIKLIPKVLQKLSEDRVQRAILVMPHWENLPFFPLVKSMSSARIMLEREDIVMSPESRLWKVNAISLIAVIISGNTTVENMRTQSA